MAVEIKIFCKQKSYLVVNLQNRIIFLPYFVGKIKDSLDGSRFYDKYFFGWLFLFFELKIYKSDYKPTDY
jgi:hypothetical protein